MASRRWFKGAEHPATSGVFGHAAAILDGQGKSWLGGSAVMTVLRGMRLLVAEE